VDIFKSIHGDKKIKAIISNKIPALKPVVEDIEKYGEQK
jgi:hypothetical protein